MQKPKTKTKNKNITNKKTKYKYQGKKSKTYICMPLLNCKEWDKGYREMLSSFCCSSVLSGKHLN